MLYNQKNYGNFIDKIIQQLLNCSKQPIRNFFSIVASNSLNSDVVNFGPRPKILCRMADIHFHWKSHLQPVLNLG